MGSLKSKLGLKGNTKPGEMISRMNALKGESLKEAVKTESAKVISNIKK